MVLHDFRNDFLLVWSILTITSLLLLLPQEIELFLELVLVVQKLRPPLFSQPVLQGLQQLHRVLFTPNVQICLHFLLCINSDQLLSLYCQLKLSSGCFLEILFPQIGDDVGLAGFCTDFDFAGIWNQAIFVTNRKKFTTRFRMFQHCRSLHDVVVLSSVP